MEARAAITVNAPPEDVYAAWRDVECLPTFVEHLRAVSTTGARRSQWVVQGPAGATVEWEAEITDDDPGERIAWRSVAGAAVDNSGVVRFAPAPGGRGTEVRLELRYLPPGRALGAFIAELFSEAPDRQIAEDLRRFKQFVETGELPRAGGPVSAQDGGALAEVGA